MADKAKHTPAPWKIQPHDTSDKSFRVGPVIIDYDDVDHAEADADARLVSAAPYLLAACKEMRDRLEAFVGAVGNITDCSQEVTALNLADKAIAKAEGGGK